MMCEMVTEFGREARWEDSTQKTWSKLEDNIKTNLSKIKNIIITEHSQSRQPQENT